MCIGRLNKQICHELPPSNLILTSKKLTVFVDYSAGNFIVRGKLFILLRNFSKDVSPCSRIKRMWSMYVHHIIGFSSKALIICSSDSSTNKMEYGGANYVSVAVPHACLKFFVKFKNVIF